MLKESLQKLTRSPQSKGAAVLLVALIIYLAVPPLLTVFSIPLSPSAQAQEELMMPLMIATMLIQLITQLFQGGGQPQKGPAEEQPPQYGTVGPQNTGPQNPNPVASAGLNGVANTTGTLFDKTFFFATDGNNLVAAPLEHTIQKGKGVNVLNAANEAKTVIIRKKGETAGTEKAIAKDGIELFSFANAGEYEICFKKADGSADCKANLKVE